MLLNYLIKLVKITELVKIRILIITDTADNIVAKVNVCIKLLSVLNSAVAITYDYYFSVVLWTLPECPRNRTKIQFMLRKCIRFRLRNYYICLANM